jgi:hypothetical protein
MNMIAKLKDNQLRAGHQLDPSDMKTRNPGTQQSKVTLTQDLFAICVTWNIDASELRTQGTKKARQLGSLLKGKQAVSYSRTHGNLESCSRGAWEPSDMASKESTQRGTMIKPISCCKTVR